MKYSYLKAAVAIILIGSHFAFIFWLLILYLLNGFLFPQLTTAIGLLVPLFAGFTTMIVKDAVAHAAPGATAEQDHDIPKAFAFLTLSFTSLFSIYLLTIITLRGFNIGLQFEEFKILLGASEGIFGIYIGMLMPTLFSRGVEDKKKR